MTIETTDLDGGIGVLFAGRGILTDQEYVDIYKRHLTQDKDKFKKYKYSLIDYSAATKVDISTESIEFIADLCVAVSKVNPDPIVTFLAKDDLVFGLARIYKAFLYETDWEIRVFRSKKDALEWIKERVKDKFGIDDLTFS